ncbi:hypothetical protein RchiOBHm_Chr1g0314771 [Rosa chinensis]|uniref:Uncharacterized protein n=1 Tax=Rosa chinensis TaxID=74649 RepID=A0A2P6S770_ROSCH|nr:hypothetical protein RchiOBHm_Chr1g0314771 [Rosa chinensis]
MPEVKMMKRAVCAAFAERVSSNAELDLNLEYKPDVREDLEAVGKKLEECTGQSCGRWSSEESF